MTAQAQSRVPPGEVTAGGQRVVADHLVGGKSGGDGTGWYVPLVPRWVPPTSFAICLLALADSAYLTYAHYAAAKIFACPISSHSFVNCASVTTGPYSSILGVPVAVLGLLWSTGMAVLCCPFAWRAQQWRAERWARLAPWVGRVRLAGSALGVVTVFWLVYVELFKKDHLCEYCTVVHVLTVALFIVLVFAAALSVPAEQDEPLGEAGP
ncbi:MAG: vitamin K epoxide reductase family protein [Acidimicrobiales bacterium]